VKPARKLASIKRAQSAAISSMVQGGVGAGVVPVPRLSWLVQRKSVTRKQDISARLLAGKSPHGIGTTS
jgi:hypothetical protein